MLLCVFAARPVEYRLDRGQVACPKRYSTGRGILYPIPRTRELLTLPPRLKLLIQAHLEPNRLISLLPIRHEIFR